MAGVQVLLGGEDERALRRRAHSGPSFVPRMLPHTVPVESESPLWFTAATTPASKSSSCRSAQYFSTHLDLPQ